MQEPPVYRHGGRARAIRFYYATQTAVRPPTFVLFCNEPRAIRAPYLRYLENKLREAFDFRGTPVRLRLRARSQKQSANPGEDRSGNRGNNRNNNRGNRSKSGKRREGRGKPARGQRR
jgi:hypothetical protein